MTDFSNQLREVVMNTAAGDKVAALQGIRSVVEQKAASRIKDFTGKYEIKPNGKQ